MRWAEVPVQNAASLLTRFLFSWSICSYSSSAVCSLQYCLKNSSLQQHQQQQQQQQQEAEQL
jgi:hypothetical protein